MMLFLLVATTSSSLPDLDLASEYREVVVGHWTAPLSLPCEDSRGSPVAGVVTDTGPTA